MSCIYMPSPSFSIVKNRIVDDFSQITKIPKYKLKRLPMNVLEFKFCEDAILSDFCATNKVLPAAIGRTNLTSTGSGRI